MLRNVYFDDLSNAIFSFLEIGSVDECQSTPTLCSREDSDVTLTRSQPTNTSHIEDSYARLSMSLEESFFRVSSRLIL